MDNNAVYVELQFPAEYSVESHQETGKKITAFERSSCHSIAIDLSLPIMIRSDQIGILAKAVKISRSRGGKTVLFVPNDTLMSILKAIHFDTITTIIRDRAEFDAAVASLGTLKPAALDAEKKAAPEAQPNESPANAAISTKQLMLGGVSAVAILAAILVSVVLILTMQSIKKERSLYLLTTYRLQQKIDSLKTVLDRTLAEDQMMRELENETKRDDRKKDNRGK